MKAPSNPLLGTKAVAKSRIRVRVTIDGEPLSKQRPRFVVNRSGTVYTPRSTKEAEAGIAWFIKAAYGALFPDDASSFGVRVVFYVKSRQRRDIDNMCKLVFDACTGLVWKDDSQVEELVATLERASNAPRTELVIYTLESTTPFVVCEVCSTRFRTYPSWGGRKYCSRACHRLTQRNGLDVHCAGCGTLVHRAAYQLKGPTGAFYCSLECRTAATSVEVRCAECGASFRKLRCLVRSGNSYCSAACSAAHTRKRAKKTAALLGGECSDCGGPTTKKSYERCLACLTLHRHVNKRGGRWKPPAGRCLDCGGVTSRVTAARCRACRLALIRTQ